MLGLGIIVRARVELQWDEHRTQYLNDLMLAVREGTAKAQLESIRFATDGMAVFHRMVGAKFRTYLRTGNPDDLGEFKDMSLKTYREFVGLFMQLSGQDDKKTTKVSGEIAHRVEVGTPTTMVDAVTTPTTGSLLDFLEKSGVVK